MLETDNVKIYWLGHASFRIESKEVVIYIDPWKIDGGPQASLVLVTHGHFDHCSSDDIQKVRGEDTVIIASGDAQSKIEGDVRPAQPGDSFEVGDIKIEAVRAYNTDKDFHPKDNSWVGYVLTIDGTRIYHAGDTDRIEEMAQLKDIGVALLPVSGTYVMTAEEAADAAKEIGAKITIPMHFGDIVGDMDDAKRFRDLCTGLQVEILEKE